MADAKRAGAAGSAVTALELDLRRLSFSEIGALQRNVLRADQAQLTITHDDRRFSSVGELLARIGGEVLLREMAPEVELIELPFQQYSTWSEAHAVTSQAARAR